MKLVVILSAILLMAGCASSTVTSTSYSGSSGSGLQPLPKDAEFGPIPENYQPEVEAYVRQNVSHPDRLEINFKKMRKFYTNSAWSGEIEWYDWVLEIEVNKASIYRLFSADSDEFEPWYIRFHDGKILESYSREDYFSVKKKRRVKIYRPENEAYPDSVTRCLEQDEPLCIESSIASNSNIISQKNRQHSLLYWTVDGQAPKVTAWLLDNHPWSESDQHDALSLALKKDDLVSYRILKKNEKPNFSDLELAIGSGAAKVATSLVEELSTLSIEQKQSALLLATEGAQPALVKSMLTRGYPAYIEESLTLQPLTKAIEMDDSVIAIAMLKSMPPPSVDRLNALYTEALMTGKSQEYQNYLRSEGAQLSPYQDKQGNNLLGIALLNNKIERLEEFILAGVDPSHINAQGDTLVHLAAGSSKTARYIADLVAQGANPFKKNLKGETPFDVALKNENLAVSKTLAPFYIAAGGYEKEIEQFLDLLIKKRSRETGKYIRMAGVSPDMKIGPYQRPMIVYAIAIDSGSDVVESILNAGGNPDVYTGLAETPTPALYAASLRRRYGYFYVLHEAGADFNIPGGDEGFTVMDWFFEYHADKESKYEIYEMGGRANYYRSIESTIFPDSSPPVFDAAAFMESVRQDAQKINEHNQYWQKKQREQQARIQAELEQKIAARNKSLNVQRQENNISPTKTMAKPEFDITKYTVTAKAGSPKVMVTDGFSQSRKNEKQLSSNTLIANQQSLVWTGNTRGGETQHTGTFRKNDSQVGECAIRNLEVKYEVSHFMGEPFVGGSHKVDDAANSCLTENYGTTFSGLEFWLIINNQGNTGYVRHSSGSPDWDQFICGFNGKQKTGCLSEEQAKQMLKGASVTGYVWSHR
ncbi:ankyrin repeat domain-containing protein [Vibrio sp. SCSIO 43136]|uniref:ankyrin repeat domain-containing protein n=1 Tax=Vibrio sp. SCSIO 43136 TaxID=2819101 RepID=UPI002075FCE6|nr:ankyrin repeat domain-containing protein [Vibrio sp. SCSIO 43136]USD67862.1 ankyrin repeat domain-containing protein [Vibrio sp. SCSIO 43136]